MMDGLKLSIPQRMTLLRGVLIFSLIISVFLSAPLWGGYRSFPYTPLLTGNLVPAPFDTILTALAVLFWIAALFLKRQRLFIFLAFALCAGLVLLDLNRLQLWFYIYNSLLAIFIFYNGRVDDPNKFTSIFIILQLVVASVYFYCGISQLNATFINSSFTEIISPLQDLMSERQFLFFKKMGSLSPYVLLFIGLGLIISPIRYIAISLAIFIHVLLLVFLFPSPQHNDYPLWLSNLVFMIMLLLLFSGKTKQRYFSPTFLFRKPLFYLVAALFLVMPALNRGNRWPDFLSSNIKSGNNLGAEITLTAAVKEKLPLYLRHFCIAQGDHFYFDFEGWCGHELHASCYPSERVFTSLCGHLRYLTGAGVKDLQLQLRPRQQLLCKP